jgi:hypothetical protein
LEEGLSNPEKHSREMDLENDIWPQFPKRRSIEIHWFIIFPISKGHCSWWHTKSFTHLFKKRLRSTELHCAKFAGCEGSR